MEQEFFKSLPSEVVLDILSRLPVRSVISCNCVQKSWLRLAETREFAKSHLSKSTPGVFICHVPLPSCNLYNIFELEHHDFIYKFVTTFNLTNVGRIMGSADGLLLLCGPSLVKKRDALYVCNPITRDYINLDFLPKSGYQSGDYGFGFNKMTKQYKVVRIFRDDIFNQETQKWVELSVVYTLLELDHGEDMQPLPCSRTAVSAVGYLRMEIFTGWCYATPKGFFALIWKQNGVAPFLPLL